MITVEAIKKIAEDGKCYNITTGKTKNWVTVRDNEDYFYNSKTSLCAEKARAILEENLIQQANVVGEKDLPKRRLSGNQGTGVPATPEGEAILGIRWSDTWERYFPIYRWKVGTDRERQLGLSWFEKPEGKGIYWPYITSEALLRELNVGYLHGLNQIVPESTKREVGSPFLKAVRQQEEIWRAQHPLVDKETYITDPEALLKPEEKERREERKRKRAIVKADRSKGMVSNAELASEESTGCQTPKRKKRDSTSRRLDPVPVLRRQYGLSAPAVALLRRSRRISDLQFGELERRQQATVTKKGNKRKRKPKRQPVQYKCQKCGKVYPTWRELRQHASRKHPLVRDWHTCGNCKRRFIHRANLNAHQWEHLQATKRLCSLCSKGFKSEYEKKEHELAHGYAKFKCTECTSAFRYPRDLARHWEEKHRAPQQPCPVPGCGYRGTKKGVGQHVRQTHRGLPCRHCGFLYKSSGSRWKHEKICAVNPVNTPPPSPDPEPEAEQRPESETRDSSPEPPRTTFPPVQRHAVHPSAADIGVKARRRWRRSAPVHRQSLRKRAAPEVVEVESSMPRHSEAIATDENSQVKKGEGSPTVPFRLYEKWEEGYPKDRPADKESSDSDVPVPSQLKREIAKTVIKVIAEPIDEYAGFALRYVPKQEAPQEGSSSIPPTTPPAPPKLAAHMFQLGPVQPRIDVVLPPQARTPSPPVVTSSEYTDEEPEVIIREILAERLKQLQKKGQDK